MKRLWRDYNLSIVLFILFILSWLLQGIFQWIEMAHEAVQHGGEPSLADFIPAFAAATFENWESEFLQLFAMVVLTSFLIHRGSHESKDQDEKTDNMLVTILERIDQIRMTQDMVQRRLAISMSVQRGGADHEFVPFSTGDGGEQLTVCGVCGCDRGSTEHPKLVETP